MGATVVLTINRPETLNLIDGVVLEWLDAMLTQIEEEEDIRSVVLTGAGNLAFSAGGGRNLEAGQGSLFVQRIESFPKPVVAAVNGIACGLGFAIAAAAHGIILSDRVLRAGHPFAGPENDRCCSLSSLVDSQHPDRVREVVRHDELMSAAMALSKRLPLHGGCGAAL